MRKFKFYFRRKTGPRQILLQSQFEIIKFIYNFQSSNLSLRISSYNYHFYYYYLITIIIIFNLKKEPSHEEQFQKFIDRQKYIKDLAESQSRWFKIENMYLSKYAKKPPIIHYSLRKSFYIFIKDPGDGDFEAENPEKI